MPIIDPRLLADIKRAEDDQHVEGNDFVAFKDTLGNWTIAYGHLLEPQTHDWTGYQITQSQADQLLSTDIADRAAGCISLPEWGSLDTDCRRNAVVECVFNLGVQHWRSEFPKTRAALQAGSWTVAAANLLASPEWIVQVGRARVARLAGYFRSGSYSPAPDS